MAVPVLPEKSTTTSGGLWLNPSRLSAAHTSGDCIGYAVLRTDPGEPFYCAEHEPSKRGRNFESPGEAYWPLFGSSCVVTDRPSINGVRRAAGPEQRLSVSTMEVVVLLCHDLRRSLHIHMCTVVLHSTPVLLRQVGEQSRESHDSSYMACAPPLFGLSLLASLIKCLLTTRLSASS